MVRYDLEVVSNQPFQRLIKRYIKMVQVTVCTLYYLKNIILADVQITEAHITYYQIVRVRFVIQRLLLKQSNLYKAV